MKKFNSYSLIHTGLLIRYLQNLDGMYKAGNIIDILNRLEQRLEDSNLDVSLSGFNNSKEFNGLKNKIKKMKKDENLSDTVANELNEEMRTIEHIVFSESAIKMVYSIPQRRYNGEYLSESPDKLLKKDVYSKISDIAKFDFSAACRCILYGEGTAVAFHVLRATEDALKQYYFHYIKRNRLKKPMWGSMTEQLSNKKSNKPDKNILSALDVIRKSYRNPTQHPELTYDIDSAQDLFGLCLDLINKMAGVLD